MPIEIKELHIRVAVNASPSGQPAGARGRAGGGTAATGADDERGRDQIVAACIEQVLTILESRKER